MIQIGISQLESHTSSLQFVIDCTKFFRCFSIQQRNGNTFFQKQPDNIIIGNTRPDKCNLFSLLKSAKKAFYFCHEKPPMVVMDT